MSEHALVIGEALVDVVVAVDGTTEAHPGGSPANVAIGLGRLGRDVELLAHLADDDNGAMVREHLAASQVELAAGSLEASRTSVATAHLDESGAANYDFDLEWAIGDGAAPRPDPLVVHTGSIAAVLAPGAESVRALVSSLRDGATVTYDPNARPSLMGSPEDARGAIETAPGRERDDQSNRACRIRLRGRFGRRAETKQQAARARRETPHVCRNAVCQCDHPA